MKTAKEMFEELGFKLLSDGLSYYNHKAYIEITVNRDLKRIDIDASLDGYCLEPKLVKAIYKLCEELGWFELES